MSTDKATPRPWVVFAPHQLSDSLRIFAGTHYIGSIGNSDDEVEITNANAALIIKAVNLFDELVVALETYQNANPLHHDGDAELFYQAEDVLAKTKES